MNSLQHEFPNLAKQFDEEANYPLALSHVSSHSSIKCWWKCEKADDHIWQACPNDRVKCSGCPFCSGRKASKSINFATAYPELLKQWDFKKNINIDPYKITRSCGKKVWWRCKKANDHIWFSSVNQRVTRQKICPFCSGRKVCKSNCLSTTHPDLLKSWNYNKNKITPDEVTYSAHKKVWWICSKGHEWEAAVYSRSAGKGCDRCKVSRGEARVCEVLDGLKYSYKREVRFISLGLKRFDFAVYLNNSTFLIEYHGKQHFEPSLFGPSKDPDHNLKLIQGRDQQKRQWAKDNGYPLLEIPYIEFDDIKDKIKGFIYVS
jgi:hypothetical protein|tara:strand:+ start:1991 stop:2944 length:954 start_codon:yes stop_codon:yes gene_type:complete